MTIPLMILAGFALGIGFVLGPTEVFAGFLGRATTFAGFAHVESGMNFGLMGFSSLIAIGGIAVAWLFYVKSPELPGRLARAVPALYQASLNKFYFDELYGAFIVRPLLGFSHFAAGFDKHVVDELVVDHLAGKTPSFLGWVLRPIQNGLVQFYALAMALSLAVILAALLRSL
jgi:NADH-quinone oxidoreductase subunit L